MKISEIKKLTDNGYYKKSTIILNNIDPEKLSASDKALYYYLKATNFCKLNKSDKAYSYYLKAKKQYIFIDSLDKAMDINLDISYLISSQENNFNNAYKYNKEYINFAIEKKDTLRLVKAMIQLGILEMDSKNYRKSLDSYRKASGLNTNIKNPALESVINNNIAVLFSEYLNQPDSALVYYKKDLEYLKMNGSPEKICYNYINQAASNYYLKNYNEAIKLLNTADSIPLKDFIITTKQYIYESYILNYEGLKDYKKAYDYSLLSKKFADSSKTIEQNIAINDIQTKYQTREKELENKALKTKNRKNKALLFISIGLLISSMLIAFLLIKNARRKEKISRQEKLIERQKLEKALKDYELQSIDLMLEGQEKERQRIANDLHDNLGSMLAALKINFENLKLRNDELGEKSKLYERTDELIEEAYHKVRRLAHAKNAGVFANEGLIPALKKMAEKISIPGKIQIQIIPFGFNERLENTLEITIFRMIQELTTNIIKHSKATEASIHLTHHDDNINIIIEDNGTGFDTSKINSADGMGLATIKKKTEQLDGSFNIDSTPGKGTAIIIDLPV